MFCDSLADRLWRWVSPFFFSLEFARAKCLAPREMSAKSRYDRALVVKLMSGAVKRWTVSCEVSDAAPAAPAARPLRDAALRKGKNVWEGRPAVFIGCRRLPSPSARKRLVA